MFEQGQQYIFGNKLKAEIGEDKFDELIQLSNTSIKRSQDDYKEMIAYYKNKLNKLTKTHAKLYFPSVCPVRPVRPPRPFDQRI